MKKICLISMILCSLVLVGLLLPESSIVVDFSLKNQAPSFSHIFGTDWYGRDIFLRTVKGLSTSILIGFATSLGSAVLALVVGICSVLSKQGDYFFGFLIDLLMSMPHLVLQLLISFSLGGGVTGVLFSLIFTHWATMARLIRSELLALTQSPWVKLSRKLGKSSIYIAFHHLLPSLYPQLLVGMILTFPHAILHEASLTFLGFGLSPEQSAIGVMISESVDYLSSGTWWILCSGVCLVLVVFLFEELGQTLKEYVKGGKYEE